MENTDLNIENYNLDDILSLFLISYNFDSNDLKISKEKLLKLHPYKSHLDSCYFDFYSQCFKIVETLHKYREKRLFVDVKYYPNYNEDNDFINKIKKVPNFTAYDDVSVIIDKINGNNNNEIVYKKIQEDKHKIESLKDDKDILITHTSSTPGFENIYSNELVSGSINSIKRITQFKNLHLNSCFRDNYENTSTSNFNLKLPNEIKNATSMKLASIEIPNSWYLFSNVKKNNIFKIIIYLDHESKDNELYECKETIKIPEGNYDNETLENLLNTTYFYETSKDSPLQYLMFSINPNNLKSKICVIDDAPSNMSFTIEFDSEDENFMNNAGWILGFRNNIYKNITDCIESEALFDGGGDRYVYFCIDDYQYNRNESNIIYFDENTLDKSILAKIPMVNGKLSLVVEQNLCDSLIKTRRYNGPVNIKKLSIKLLDKFGEIIDLNGMDFSFTLEMELLYERNGVV